MLSLILGDSPSSPVDTRHSHNFRRTCAPHTYSPSANDTRQSGRWGSLVFRRFTVPGFGHAMRPVDTLSPCPTRPTLHDYARRPSVDEVEQSGDRSTKVWMTHPEKRRMWCVSRDFATPFVPQGVPPRCLPHPLGFRYRPPTTDHRPLCPRHLSLSPPPLAASRGRTGNLIVNWVPRPGSLCSVIWPP